MLELELLKPKLLEVELIGSAPSLVPLNNQEKIVTPTTSEQEITYDKGYSGLEKVIVEAVTNEIDKNIMPSNIKAGVNILGVDGNVEPDKPDQNKSVKPTTQQQVIRPDIGYELAEVTIGAIETEEKIITPTKEEQIIIPDEDKYFSKITIMGDDDLIPENISEGKSIFGVKGTAQTTDISEYFKTEGLSNTTSSKTLATQMIKKFPKSDTSNLTSFNYAFAYSPAKEFPLIDTSNGNNFSSMYNYCTNLEEAPPINTSKGTNFSNMHNYNSNLKKIPEYDMSNAINVAQILYQCSNLEEVGGFKNLGKAYTKTTANYSNYTLSLTYCSKLTHDSLMNIINNLYDLNLTYDVANGGTLYTQTLQLTPASKDLLTEEEKAIAINKGWNIA